MASALIQVEELKSRGNVTFKSGDYLAAIGIYTEGIRELNDQQLRSAASGAGSEPRQQTGHGLLHAALLGNRAECHLKLRNWEAAAEDARQSKELAPPDSAVLAKAERRLARAVAGREAFKRATPRFGQETEKMRRELVTLAFKALANEDWRTSKDTEAVVAMGPLSADDLQQDKFDSNSAEDHTKHWNGRCDSEAVAATAVARALGCLFEVENADVDRVPAALLLAARSCLWLARATFLGHTGDDRARRMFPQLFGDEFTAGQALPYPRPAGGLPI
eukprot:SAG31_NODE_12726_length_921_cov_0.978102_1_plen_276_part_10